jgi:hypothetical protein
MAIMSDGMPKKGTAVFYLRQLMVRPPTFVLFHQLIYSIYQDDEDAAQKKGFGSRLALLMLLKRTCIGHGCILLQ